MRSMTRSFLLGLTLAAAGFACACPEKKVAEPSGPGTPAPSEPAPTGGGGGTTEPTPTPTPTPTEPPAGAALPDKPGAECTDAGCGGGLTCVKYYGIAGPRGPEFRSCEIPCPNPDDKCPAGLSCTTIADGPGRVCR